MVLDFPSIFPGIFRVSAEDSQVWEAQGSRTIPITVTSSIQEGPNEPYTAVDDATIGTVAWTNPSYAATQEGANGANVGVNTAISSRNIKLVKAGSVVGTGETFTLAGAPAQLKFEGGPTSLWGTTWTPAQINATTFGCVVWCVGDDPETSHYLKITDYGFSIPTTATILGIEAFIFGDSAGVGPVQTYVNSVNIKIYYSLPKT